MWYIPLVRANDDHEAKFPLELPRRFIQLLTEPGEIVLDCFMGSGTTAVAAIQRRRQFIGIELLEEYVKRHYWKGMPAHTSLRDIIQGTCGAQLEQSFRQYSAFLLEKKEPYQFIACDGKVLCGSFDHFQDQKAVQILSAFASDSQIILAHEEIATKTNEIPMAQMLLKELGLSGYIFTFDGLHCQKTLQTAKATGNEVIVQVKANQKTLFNDCQTLSATTCPDEVYQELVPKTRNRIESRQVEIFISPALTDSEQWSLVKLWLKCNASVSFWIPKPTPGKIVRRPLSIFQRLSWLPRSLLWEIHEQKESDFAWQSE